MFWISCLIIGTILAIWRTAFDHVNSPVKLVGLLIARALLNTILIPLVLLVLLAGATLLAVVLLVAIILTIIDSSKDHKV